MAENDKNLIAAQISSITSLRVNEHHAWMTIFSACLATTALLLIALFQDGPVPGKIQGIVICSFGFLVSVVHLWVQIRALKTMVAHENALNKLFTDNNLESPGDYIKKAKCIGAREVMRIFTVLQLIGWIFGIVLFSCISSL